MSKRRRLPTQRLSLLIVLLAIVCASRGHAAGSDIVLYAADAINVNGQWWINSDWSAAGGQTLASTDYGWSSTNTALAWPSNYVEFTFSAPANTPFHVWLRMKAWADSKWNDSVYVQFSDSVDSNGSAIDRIGTTAALTVNLQSCNGCTLSGWGWMDGAYWLSQLTTVSFSTDGTHTLRIQTREDGVMVDQVVLSPSTYLWSAPGPQVNDWTILPHSSESAPSPSSSGPTPYSGTPVALPGRIEAENFDNGGEGVSYHDTTTGNAGGQYRATDVDIEYSTEGGYDVGWTAAGEWLNYTVNVANAGSYTAQLRVASPSGATMHIGFNGPSNLWFTADIPATGGWQSWRTVNVPVPLGAGVQQMTLFFDTSGANVNYVDVTSGGSSGSPPPAPPPPSSGGGTDLIVAEWNIQVDDSSSSHARSVIDYLMALTPQPQVIVITEAHASQYNTYINELQNRSSYNWAGNFLSECPLGSWNGWCTGSEDEGTAIFSMLPINDSSATYLPYADSYHAARALVRLAINVNGANVNVFGTHLQVNNASARYNSMAYLKWWASNYSGTKLVAGDFNADPDQIDTSSGMAGAFVDTWPQLNGGKALTSFTPNPTMQLDYIFVDSSGNAVPKWEWVVTPTGQTSDHYPLHAAITIRQ